MESEGGEVFHALGSERERQLAQGDYIYRDDEAVLCHLEARQAQHSALTGKTTAALFIVQGHDGVPFDYIRGVAEELRKALTMFCSAGD